MEPKTTTLHNTCSRSLLWIRFVAVAFRSKKVFWRRGPPPPWWPIWPRPRSTPGSGLETYFFSHSQTFASGINLNLQIAVSNSQLDFPTFEQFLTLRCGMAIVSLGWDLVHRSPLRWQRTCWRPHSSFLRLKKYIIFFRHCRHMVRQRVCVTRRFDFSTAFTVDLLKHLWDQDRDSVLDEISSSQLFSSAYIFNSQNWISTRILRVCKHEFWALQIWPKHLYACARPWELHPYQVS